MTYFSQNFKRGLMFSVFFASLLTAPHVYAMEEEENERHIAAAQQNHDAMEVEDQQDNAVGWFVLAAQRGNVAAMNALNNLYGFPQQPGGAAPN